MVVIIFREHKLGVFEYGLCIGLVVGTDPVFVGEFAHCFEGLLYFRLQLCPF